MQEKLKENVRLQNFTLTLNPNDVDKLDNLFPYLSRSAKVRELIRECVTGLKNNEKEMNDEKETNKHVNKKCKTCKFYKPTRNVNQGTCFYGFIPSIMEEYDYCDNYEWGTYED